MVERTSHKIALITGVTGQDGSYLVELLLEKDYDAVYGIIRRSSSIITDRIDHLFHNPRLLLRYGDLLDSSNMTHILFEIRNKHPDLERLEVYNLGAMSHVKISFELPEYTGEVDALGTLRILDALLNCGIPLEKIRFYQASTSELFGLVQETPQRETTPFYPRSPYGVAKLYGFWITKNYRESYGLFACNGILFNHESPRRGHNFVTRKITLGLQKILTGEEDKLVLGNLDAKRDWGHARDYVEGMWRMLQSDTPDDYVLATMEQHTVREFVEAAFAQRGIMLRWKGHGVEEVGYEETSGRVFVEVSPKYFRPSEVDQLLGDPTKALEEIGWSASTSFDELVTEMVDADCPLRVV